MTLDTDAAATPTPAAAATAAAAAAHDEIHTLARGDVEVVLRVGSSAFPEVLHWGPHLGRAAGEELWAATKRGVSPSALDEPGSASLVPVAEDGFQGRPAIVVRDAEGARMEPWEPVDLVVQEHRCVAVGRSGALRLSVAVEVTDAGVVSIRHDVTNDGPDPVEIGALEAVLPVGPNGSDFMDFSGRWTRERSPQRSVLLEGSRVRESRRGRTGHDAPFVTAVGDAGFDHGHGRVWAVHLAWSSDAVFRVDALPEDAPLLGAGVLIRPGEVRLLPGESFQSPEALFAFSAEGLDGVGRRYHDLTRARRRPRRAVPPVTLNTWEAVYFSHDLDTLAALADRAADVGVERFVLDDGWFRGRRSDTSALGDWMVDEEIWPQGLRPLVDHVRARGMEFGLWFEPEMVSPESELARAHPDWVLGPPGRWGRTWRHQHVLDVARTEVFEYLLERIGALVSEYSIDYIKWDHNRDLLDAASDGMAGTIAQTRAVYRLMDELRDRFPLLEIESCASGGARVDLGVAARVDRFWASDTNDPLERLRIQRWTELLVPPEMIGSHIGPEVAHTTGRKTSLATRVATAMIGSFGIEWDITSCSEAELAELARGIDAYKRFRPMLVEGTVRHLPSTAGYDVTAVLAADSTAALMRIVAVDTSPRSVASPVPLPGLAPGSYEVRLVSELARPAMVDLTPPAWMDQATVRMSAESLAASGVRPPLMRPGGALMVEVRRIGDLEK